MSFKTRKITPKLLKVPRKIIEIDLNISRIFQKNRFSSRNMENIQKKYENSQNIVIDVKTCVRNSGTKNIRCEEHEWTIH
jgi:hypothetical protein